MNWDIFRAYDIRGVYPDDLNEDAFYRIAKAYTYLFRPRTMVVGMDARESSPKLKDSLIAGFVDAGVNVVDIGGITTDMLYFAVGSSDYSGGIVVSASHNPRQYNGAKMVREKAAAISSDTGLFDIRDALKAEKDKDVSSDTKGKVEQKDVLRDYIEHVLTFIDRDVIKPFKFVGNANFGYVSRGVALIAEKLALNLLPLNFEPDGTFPKGTPDPLQPANRAEAAQITKDSDADFAALWDADADLRKENAIFAGEMSGHYYFRENFYADNGVIPFLLVVEYLSKTGKSFSEMMQPYMEGHFMSGELNYRVDDTQKTIDEVRKTFSKEGAEDFTDGYSLQTDSWRFNIRSSNTEPLLRLNIEARKDALVEKARDEIEEIIGSKPG